MVELLQTFSRVVVAFLSGALLMAGTAFWADVLRGSGIESPFDQIAQMLAGGYANIFLVITALAAYAIGMINFAGSGVALGPLANATESELLIVSRIESLQRPQLLKEILEIFQLRRALVAFAFPLFYFGLALAFDFHEKSFSESVRILAGISLAVLACVSLFFAARMSRLVDRTARKLLAEIPDKTLNPTGNRPAG